MHRLDIVYVTFLSFLRKNCRFTLNGLLQAQEVGVCWCGTLLTCSNACSNALVSGLNVQC